MLSKACRSMSLTAQPSLPIKNLNKNNFLFWAIVPTEVHPKPAMMLGSRLHELACLVYQWCLKCTLTPSRQKESNCVCVSMDKVQITLEATVFLLTSLLQKIASCQQHIHTVQCDIDGGDKGESSGQKLIFFVCTSILS